NRPGRAQRWWRPTRWTMRCRTCCSLPRSRPDWLHCRPTSRSMRPSRGTGSSPVTSTSTAAGTTTSRHCSRWVWTTTWRSRTRRTNVIGPEGRQLDHRHHGMDTELMQQHVQDMDTEQPDEGTGRPPVRSVLVGAGHRGRVYGRFAETWPADMSFTVVVERDPDRRAAAPSRHEVPSEHQYASVDELPPAGIHAEAAICATMDADHVEVATTLLRKGYHVLLEK